MVSINIRLDVFLDRIETTDFIDYCLKAHDRLEFTGRSTIKVELTDRIVGKMVMVRIDFSAYVLSMMKIK